MPTPLHTPNGLALLRRAATLSLRHTGRQVIQRTTELPDEEIEPVGEPTLGPPTCCLLDETDYTPAEIAASNGVKTRWEFQPPRGLAVAIGSVWQVETDCATETVELVGNVKKNGRVLRLFAAVDVPLNS